MNAIERLKGSMVRVEALVDFYRQSPTATLDMLDSMTDVTIQDLETLLDALKDRDISLKRPKFKTPREIERDAKLAKIIVDEREIWERGYDRGYDKGYEAGRTGRNGYLQGKL